MTFFYVYIFCMSNSILKSQSLFDIVCQAISSGGEEKIETFLEIFLLDFHSFFFRIFSFEDSFKKKSKTYEVLCFS